MIKYIFFDVSGTLLYKPTLYQNLLNSLKDFGYNLDLNDLKYKHKLLSEIIHFPDRTDEVFYNKFNSQLLNLLGIVPNKDILKSIFTSCTYLPWEAFADTSELKKISVPIGIISNFNITLKTKLSYFFGDIFKDVFVSEELGVSKPNPLIYLKALEKVKLSPDEILYIGDSVKLDLEPANSLGIKTLIIDRDNFYYKSEYIISNFNDLHKYL